MFVKNYLKESLLSILCFMIQGKGSSEKDLILNSSEKFMGFDTECIASLHALSEIGILFLPISIPFLAGKGFYEIFCLSVFIDVLYSSLTNFS